MATYTHRLEVSLLQSGLTAGSALGYRVEDANGATLIARTTTGVTEDGTSANYYATVAGWDTSWSGTVVWDAGAGTLSRDAFLDRQNYALSAAGLDPITVEAGVNARQALSPILAASAGVLSGAGTGTITIKGGNVATTRIAATTDALGNRSAITLTLPA